MVFIKSGWGNPDTLTLAEIIRSSYAWNVIEHALLWATEQVVTEARVKGVIKWDLYLVP